MTEASATLNYSERLYNEDLAPTKERTWTAYSLFAMWMADVHSIGGYTFAAGLFFLGLTGWQVFLALIAGITFVYFLINLTSVAFSRFAPTERMVRVGNFWGLPVNFVLFSAVVVVATVARPTTSERSVKA